MRVILDTNILISYLLPSRQGETIQAVVDAALRRAFTLILPPELVQEFSRKLATKKYLNQRIRYDEAARFLMALAQAAEVVPPLTSAIPQATRDAKDDYLLAYALVGEADYLVTGDEDMLEMGEVSDVRIIRPADFLRILQGEKSSSCLGLH